MSAEPPGDGELRLRRRFRWAAGWLLIHAGAHLPQHWRLFLHPDGPPAAQQAMVETLRAMPVRTPAGSSLWEVIGALSLGYALLLVMLGTACWILSREAPCDALRRHAWRNALLGAIALLLFALMHPLVQPLLAFGGATGLFLWSALASPAPGSRLRS